MIETPAEQTLNPPAGPGPRRMTAEELERFDAAQAAAQPLHELRHQVIAKQRDDAESTIAMLERRTKKQVIDLELEGGDVIQVYSRLSKADDRKIQDIEEERAAYVREGENLIVDLRKVAISAENPITSAQIAQMQNKISGLFDRALDCWLKIIAIITVDPAISYEWLKENPDKFSPEDIVDAYLGYKEARKHQIAQRAERVKRAISFRKDPGGEGLHPAPALDGDKEPAGVRGSPA